MQSGMSSLCTRCWCSCMGLSAASVVDTQHNKCNSATHVQQMPCPDTSQRQPRMCEASREHRPGGPAGQLRLACTAPLLAVSVTQCVLVHTSWTQTQGCEAMRSLKQVKELPLSHTLAHTCSHSETTTLTALCCKGSTQTPKWAAALHTLPETQCAHAGSAGLRALTQPQLLQLAPAVAVCLTRAGGSGAAARA